MAKFLSPQIFVIAYPSNDIFINSPKNRKTCTTENLRYGEPKLHNIFPRHNLLLTTHTITLLSKLTSRIPSNQASKTHHNQNALLTTSPTNPLPRNSLLTLIDAYAHHTNNFHVYTPFPLIYRFITTLYKPNAYTVVILMLYSTNQLPKNLSNSGTQPHYFSITPT